MLCGLWRASVWVLCVLLSCVSLSVVARGRSCGCAERETEALRPHSFKKLAVSTTI